MPDVKKTESTEPKKPVHMGAKPVTDEDKRKARAEWDEQRAQEK